MDFRFSEEQTALRDLAREILANESSVERVKAAEAAGDFFDRATWQRLAEANLLGIAVPEAQGGMGMGFLELCLLLHETGRAVAPLPALPTLAGAALPIARFGSEAQRERWLTPLAKGECVLAAASCQGEPARARRDGTALRLDGSFENVPAVGIAERVLVAARDAEGEILALVDPAAAGVSHERRQTSRHEPLHTLTLTGAGVAADDVLRGNDLHAWTRERSLVACAATQLGVSERALEITVAYLREREQFGAPLGALAPVQHRCADCYIDLDALRWVTWLAAWRLAEERPAAREARVAKFWAADAGSRIATATQHLHGGMGVDLDYPIHRYFLWTKALELSLGAATPQLLELGRELARSGPREAA